MAFMTSSKYKPLTKCFPAISSSIPNVYLDVSLIELFKMGDCETWQMIAEYKSSRNDEIVETISHGTQSFKMPIYRDQFSLTNTMIAHSVNGKRGAVLQYAQRSYQNIKNIAKEADKKYKDGKGFYFNNTRSKQIISSLKNLLGAV